MRTTRPWKHPWTLGALGAIVVFCGCERRPDSSTPRSETSTSQAVGAVRRARQPQEIKAALEELDRRLAANPKDAGAYIERGKLHRELGDLEASERRWEEARAAWEDFRMAHELAGGVWDFPDPFEVLARAVDNPAGRVMVPAAGRGSAGGSVEALLGAEKVAEDLEMFPICAQLLERAAQIEPAHPVLRIRRVTVSAVLEGDWQAAVQKLTAMSAEQALRESAEFWHALGFAYHQVCDLKAAAAAYRQALELSPGKESTQTNLATVLSDLGELEEAQKLFEAVGAANENALFAHNNYAAALNRRGRYREAVAVLRPVMERNPGFPMGWQNLGAAYEGLKEYELAVQAYEKFSRLLPHDVNGPFYVGCAYRRWGRLEDALRAFDRALAMSPTAAGALLESALTLAELGRHAEAESRFRRALRKEPNDSGILGHFGAMLYEQKRYEEAREVLKRALEQKPRNFGEYLMNVHNAAHLELDAGHPEAAIEIARACYDKHPKSERAFSELYLVLDRAGRSEEAQALLEKACEAHPTWADPHVWRANRYLAVNQYREALAALNRALEIRTDADHLASRAFVQWLLDRPEEALADFRAALRDSPGHVYASMGVWILERERRVPDDAGRVLAEALRRAAPSSWGAKLLHYYAGEISGEQLIAAATTPGEKCEAYYYIGERARLEHGVGAAMPWYQKCVAEDQPDYWETRLARSRLERAK